MISTTDNSGMWESMVVADRWPFKIKEIYTELGYECLIIPPLIGGRGWKETVDKDQHLGQIEKKKMKQRNTKEKRMRDFYNQSFQIKEGLPADPPKIRFMTILKQTAS